MKELELNSFLELRSTGLTFAKIGELYGLTERQVNYRTKKWGLDYSKKKALDENFFSSGTKAAYYWAGVLASDGWIEECRDRVGLAFKKSDIEHLEKFKRATSAAHDICPFMNDTAMRIRFNSSKMVKDLRDIFNITGAKTFTYRMPYIEEDYLLLEFLRGYIDGDGHIEYVGLSGLRLHLCSANKQFLEDYKEICSLLINRTINGNVRWADTVFSISFNIKDSIELLNLFYKNSTNETRLTRKYNTYFKVISYNKDNGIVR